MNFQTPTMRRRDPQSHAAPTELAISGRWIFYKRAAPDGADFRISGGHDDDGRYVVLNRCLGSAHARGNGWTPSRDRRLIAPSGAPCL